MKLEFYKICLFFAVLVFALNASAQRVQNPKFEKEIDQLISYQVPVITVKEAYDLHSNYVLLDARELAEYNVSHIPEAKHIGYDDFDLSSIAKLSKDETIIVYCSIGYRSEHIGEKIIKAGFQNVYNLYGSIFEWVNEGLPVVDRLGNKTFRIHTYNKKWSKWVEHPDMEKVW